MNTRLCWALFVAALAYSSLQAFGLAVNHDVGAYLLEARAVAEGRELYTSLREFNLPSNLWLPMLSLRLSRTLPFLLADIHTALLLLVLATISGVTGYIVRLTGRDGAFALIAPAYFALVFICLPRTDLGQREHLFAALSAPLVAIIWARLNGTRPSAAIGVAAILMAAFGASQKPHFMAAIAVVGLVELALVRKIQKVAPETWGTAFLLTLYLGWIVVRYPTYFTEVLPGALPTYGSMGKPWGEVTRDLASPHATGLIGATLLLALFLVQPRERGVPLHRPFVAAWLAILVTAAAVFLIQRQGFSYHRLVLDTVAAVSVAVLACRLLDSYRGTKASPGQGAVSGLAPVWLPLLLLVVPAIPWLSPGETAPTRSEAITDPMTAMMRSSPGALVLSLQTGTPPFSPLHAYADIRWRAGFTTLFEMLPIILQRDAVLADTALATALAREETAVRGSVLEAVRAKPDIVFVDVSVPLRWFERYPKMVRILDFLREDPAFVEAWAGYERVSTFTTIFGLRVEAYRARSR